MALRNKRGIPEIRKFIEKYYTLSDSKGKYVPWGYSDITCSALVHEFEGIYCGVEQGPAMGELQLVVHTNKGYSYSIRVK